MVNLKISRRTVSFVSGNNLNCTTVLRTLYDSSADSECLYRIPEPNFSILDPGSKRFRIPDLLKGTYLSIFNPKNFS
jgi:hypothetical protein